MEIVVVPQLTDNYSYLIIDTKNNVCAVVDPVEPEKVIAVTKERNLQVTHILSTHEHWDHVGGNLALIEILGDGVVVVGGVRDRIPGLTHGVKGGDEIKIGSEVTVHVLDTPCHTPGHVSYYCVCEGSGPGAVFTGDTLFVGGCGNFNSGTPEQMHNALQAIVSLPDDTLVYVGHEYTVKNLSWAIVVEPGNKAAVDQLEAVKALRMAGEPSVPSTIQAEKSFNPFVRVVDPVVQAWAGCLNDPVATLAKVRAGKDEWGRSS